MTVLAVTLGGVVWAVIAAAVATWLVLTLVWRRLPHAGDVARWIVTSWPGRVLALAIWAEVGWHVFCQRP